MSRLGTAADVLGAGLLVAGAIGVARQRRERRRVARGELAPVTSATLAVPSSRQGPLARAVSTWTPGAPPTAVTRALAYLWAAPATAVGALIATSTGGHWGWDREHGCVVVEGATGGSAWLLARMGISANAIGHVVVSRRSPTPPLLLAHEAAHVRQVERLGPLLLPLYVYWWARHGYRDNPLEQGARAAARRWADARDGATARS